MARSGSNCLSMVPTGPWFSRLALPLILRPASTRPAIVMVRLAVGRAGWKMPGLMFLPLIAMARSGTLSKGDRANMASPVALPDWPLALICVVTKSPLARMLMLAALWPLGTSCVRLAVASSLNGLVEAMLASALA